MENCAEKVEEMSKEELKLETALVIREIIEKGIMRSKDLINALNVSGATIAGWKSDIPARWIGVETAKKVLPILKSILEGKEINNISILKSQHRKPCTRKITKPKLIVKEEPITSAPTKKLEGCTSDDLKKIYQEKLGLMDDKIEGRLNEYFGYLEYARPHDWQGWADKGIDMVYSKKELNGDAIAYLIGIYKGWLSTNCWGGYRTDVHAQITKKIEDRFSVKFTVESTHQLHQLLANYGTIDVMEAIFETKMPDPSVIVTNSLIKYCEMKKFDKQQD